MSNQDNEYKNNYEKSKSRKGIEETKKIASKSQEIINNKYDALFSRIVKLFRFFNSKIDLLLNHTMIAKIFALVVAIGLFISVNSTGNISIYGQSSVGKNLYSVPVKAIYNNEMYQIENLPETVDLSLVGSIEGIRKTELIGDQEVIADLKNYKPGLNQKVQLLYSGVADDVTVRFSQPTYEVNIYEKVSETFLIEEEFIRVPLNNQYDYRVEFKSNSIEIRAAQHTLDSIASVRAMIDVSGKKDDFQQAATLAIFDENGKLIDQISLTFDSVDVEVKVSKKND